MSASYEPDNDPQTDEPWATVFLSTRDVSGQVPINFVTHPGISLTSACFANNTYSQAVAQRCLSGLLAGEFRRFIVDIYWDLDTRQYTLCPVAIPGIYSNDTSDSSSATATAATTSTTGLSTASISSHLRTSSSIVLGQSSTLNRTSTVTRTTSSAQSASATSSMSASVASVTSPTGEVLLQLGPYLCSPSLNVQWVASLFLDYFQKTSDTIKARVVFIELNLHAAAETDLPETPPQNLNGDELPRSGEFVGDIFTETMYAYIYQPELLQSERSDLNNSWFDTPTNTFPIAEFFRTQELSGGDLSTSDGWPTENYILISRAMRVLLNWGRIDPQMQGYDFSGDNNTIFSASEVVEARTIDSNGAGDLISGCFYQAGTTGADNPNSSWARTTQNQLSLDLINNITSCGLSPILNSTLHNIMASDDITSYNSYMRSTIWSWAAGEPRNKSEPGVDMDAPQSQYRCAVLDPTSTYKGHWRVDNCQIKYPVACRVNNQPYQWMISSQKVFYGAASAACPANTTFDVPRTGLENTYLYRKILQISPSSATNEGGIDGVWINFNSLDVKQCWVDSGPNGLCPYYEDPHDLQTRSILVPTIGVLIVLFLTFLTFFVKCNANHKRNARSRRRGIALGAWEYEGVPS